VTVSLTKTAMGCGSLGPLDPALAGGEEEHSLREPAPTTLLGDVHMLAPPVCSSHTPSTRADPILIPRGWSPPEWRT